MNMKNNFIKKKCFKRLFWFKWYKHKWEEQDFFFTKRTIGKVPDTFDIGMWKVRREEWANEKCKVCHLKRKRSLAVVVTTYRINHY